MSRAEALADHENRARYRRMMPGTDTDTAEIDMIRQSAAGIAPRGGDRKRIRSLRFTSPGFDPSVFRQMGELGWIGLRLHEMQGGSGLGVGALCAVAEELGAALTPEPLVPAILSASLLAAANATAELADLISGQTLVSTAWQEAAGTIDILATPGTARLFIPYAGGATGFLVPVRAAGRVELWWQPGDGADLQLAQTQDGGTFGTLRPAGGTRLSDDVGAALDTALDEATLATAAMLLGVMDQAFTLTLDYLRTRQQFGRPIGSFQVLQHRAADLNVQIALSRASIAAAAATLDRDGAPAGLRRAVVSRAKARASDAALLVTRQAIQFHGGIGYTDEADIGLYLRRAMVLANQFGSPAVHRRRFAENAPEEDEA